jgi:glycosyltransferase involved in cell wall biosynthesis
VKIAFVTTYDPANVRAWSGIGHYMARALQSPETEVRHMGPLREAKTPLFKAKQAIYKGIGLRHLRDREPAILRSYAAQVASQLGDADWVFSPGTLPIATLKCRQPIAFWTDATFAGMVGYYPEFSNLSPESIRNGNAMEKAALDNATLCVYSSEWAAESAALHYGVSRSKIAVVPFGANMDITHTADDVAGFVADRPADRCELLFIGQVWHRKGGDVAVQVATALNQAGLPTTLTVVGADPVGAVPEFVQPLGFISKETESGRKLLEHLFRKAHFFILPSRNECYGIAFCEANAFGVPVLTSDTGGIASVIRNGLNGFMFRSGDEYSTTASALIANPEAYRSLCASTFREYADRLNWAVAGEQVRRLLRQHRDEPT